MTQSPARPDADGWLLLAVVVGAALAFGPHGGVDGATVGQATVVVLGAILTLGLAAWRGIRGGALHVPRSAAVLAAAAFAAIVIVRGLLASEPAAAFAGPFGRWNGVAIYSACVVLFCLAVARPTASGAFLRGLPVAGIVVGVLAVDEEFVGIGPAWAPRPGAAATLANPNFLAAWSAIVLAFALVLAGDRHQPRGWRLLGAAAVPVLLVAMLLSRSLQAGYVAGAVLAILALIWAVDHLSPLRFRVAGIAASLGGAALAVITILGALGHGPAGLLAQQVGVQLRMVYWSAALAMFRQAPFTGVGPGTYRDHLRLVRSPEIAADLSLESQTSAAHNVWLHLLAEWGLIVTVAHIAVTVVVAWLAIRELSRRQGADRLRYGALVAGWAGYVLQATISIDTPPLVILGWVLAGLVVAPQARGVWSWSLPWRGGGRNRVSSPARAAQVVVAVLLLAAGHTALLPLCADLASATGVVQLDSSEDPPATSAAVRRAPWFSEYWLQVVSGLVDTGELEVAAQTAASVQARFPQRFELTVTAARLHAAIGDDTAARSSYERALELEPHHPDLAVEVARFAEDQEDLDWAVALLERALAMSPGHTPARELQERIATQSSREAAP